MTTIPVKKELLEELVDLKLNFLNDEMDKILSKWKYESASKFLQDARNGTIEEAKDDAITLKNLLDQREEIHNLVSGFQNERYQASVKENKIKELEEKLNEYGEGIVGLQDNWDSQGSKAITEESWLLTTNLLKKILFKLWEKEYNVPIPLVLPNTDNSFDVYWKTDKFELLLNIPPHLKELIHLFGEKIGFPEYEIDVRINQELVQGVVVEWLKKII